MSVASGSSVLNRGPGWYRGDFHVHTNASQDEAAYPLILVTGIGRMEGLDFVAITDHNTLEGLPQAGVFSDLLVVPGVEVTLSQGDFNVFGVDRWHAWIEGICTGDVRVPLPARHRSTTELMRRTAAAGLLNSINHPCLPPWEWRDDATDLRYVHCLEVWNDPYWPDNAHANPKAVALWTAWLDAGHRITAIGGSDYHHPPRPEEGKPGERIGLPSTYVFAEQLSVSAILDGLRRRRVYVSSGPRVTFTAHTDAARHGIGADLGEWSGRMTLEAHVLLGATDTAQARIVSSSGVRAVAWIHDDQKSLECELTIKPPRRHWYRLEVLSAGGDLLAITNPIFVGPRSEPRLSKYGDFRP